MTTQQVVTQNDQKFEWMPEWGTRTTKTYSYLQSDGEGDHDGRRTYLRLCKKCGAHLVIYHDTGKVCEVQTIALHAEVHDMTVGFYLFTKVFCCKRYHENGIKLWLRDYILGLNLFEEMEVRLLERLDLDNYSFAVFDEVLQLLNEGVD